jgi:PQQ-dependent catabolism-associated CXXCW motif protein
MRSRRSAVTAMLAMLLAAPHGVAADETPPEPAAYRLDHYRAPTPATVLGRQGLTTAEAERLWRSGGAAFVDVLPAPHRPEGLAAGAVWAPRPRRSIPGSTWLPEVGRGELAPAVAGWFAARLEQITAHDRSAPLVFFCLADCWMSWNATRRALEWGYRGAQWYPGGTDDWEQAGLPLAQVAPPRDEPR